MFSLQLGSGTSQVNNLEGSASYDSKVFYNNGAVAAFTGCPSGLTFSPGDDRVVRISYDLGSGLVAMTPDVPITNAPYAMVADSLQGITPSGLIQVVSDPSNQLTQANVQYVFNSTNYPVLQSLLAGTDSKFISSTPTSTVSLNGQTLTNLNTPVNATDAVTKSYADSDLGGKTLNLAGIGPGVGGGKTLVWDQTAGQWVAQTAGSMSYLATGTGLLGGPITSAGTLSVDVGTTANKILQLSALAQIPAVDGSLLFNVNATKLATRNVASTAPTAGQVLAYNASTSQWEPQSTSGITALTGDVVASGAGSVTATIQPNAVNASAKISNTGIAVNRLVITDATTGTTLGYGTCNLNQVYQWTSTGWACTDISTMLGSSGVTAATYGNSTQVPQVSVDSTGRVTLLSNINIAFPVTSVAGRTGAVTLNAADISGLGTAALQNYGTASGNLVQLDGTAHIPASLLPTTTGTVTSIVSGTGLVANTITTTGTLNVDVGTNANQIVQLTASAQLPSVDGFLLSNINATNLQGRAVASTAPSAGQVLTYNALSGSWDAEAATGGIAGYVNGGNTFGIGATLGTNDNNSLSFKTNNATAMTILTNGYVGIGTTSPQGTLDVEGGTASSGSGANIIFTAQNASASGANHQGGGFTFTVGDGTGGWGTGNVDYFMSHGGNVGVFSIESSNPNGNAYTPTSNSSSGPSPQFVLSTGSTTNGSFSFQTYRVNNSSNAQAGYFGAVSVSGGTNYAPAFVWGQSTGSSSYAETMRIDSTGNLGIGTTSPSSILDIYGLGTLQSAMIVPRDTTANRPSSPVNGMIRYASDTGRFEVYQSNSWQNMIAATNGTVTNIISGTGLVANTITGTGTLNVDIGTVANKIVQLTASAQYPADDGSLITNVNASRIGTRTMASTTPSAGQILGWNMTNSDWEPTNPAAIGVTDIVSGTGLVAGSISSTGTLNVDVGVTANKIMQLTSTAQIPAVDGYLVTNINASNLQGQPVASTTPSAGEVLTFNSLSGKWDAEAATAGAFGYVNGGNSFGTAATLGTNDNNSLSFKTNSATAMTILTNGYVGIGTASPSNILSLNGGAAQTFWMERNSSGNGNNLTIQAGGAAVGANNAQGGNLILSTGTSTGDGNWQSTQILFNVVNGGGSPGTNDVVPANVMGVSSFNGAPQFWLGTNVNQSAPMEMQFNAYQSYLSSGGTTGHISSLGAPTPGMAVFNSGWFDGGYAYYEMQTTNSSGNNQSAYMASVAVTGATSYTPALVFGSSNSGTHSERMRIDFTGNVGIGTTSPQTTLDVNGPINMRQAYFETIGDLGTLSGSNNITGFTTNVYNLTAGATNTTTMNIPAVTGFPTGPSQWSVTFYVTGSVESFFNVSYNGATTNVFWDANSTGGNGGSGFTGFVVPNGHTYVVTCVLNNTATVKVFCGISAQY